VIFVAWTKLTENWSENLQAIARRFPHVSAQMLDPLKGELMEISRVIAQTHDLTKPEAREELENFIDLQSLARKAADFRSHDAATIAATSPPKGLHHPRS